ncbi:MAG: ribbon-helix-helix domain-containing protein [Xenococcaceae cyanobacterium]
MTKENRFEGLMGAVGKGKTNQTSKQSNVQTSKTRQKSASKSNVETSKQLNVSTSEQPDIQTVKRSDAQTSNQPNIQPAKKAKSVNPDYTRTTVYLPKKMHKQLKAIALDEEREMSSIVEELIDTWLSNRK